MRIGVTGNYASGKGTVCAIFEELGGRIIDTDLLAREIVMPGAPVLAHICERFGGDLIRPDGSLDRVLLASRAFGDSESVKALNAIMHPPILELTLRQSAGNSVYFINTPLLFESGFDKYMDYTIAVNAARDLAATRGMRRDGIGLDMIEARRQYQFSFNEIAEKADFIIDNNADLESTREQVLKLWKTIQTLNQRE